MIDPTESDKKMLLLSVGERLIHVTKASFHINTRSALAS